MSGGLVTLFKVLSEVAPKAAQVVPRFFNPTPILIGTKSLADALDHQSTGAREGTTQHVSDITVAAFQDPGLELVSLEPWDPEGADKGKPDGGPAVSPPGEGDGPPELRDWMKKHFHYADPYVAPDDGRSDVATRGGSVPGSIPGSPPGSLGDLDAGSGHDEGGGRSGGGGSSHGAVRAPPPGGGGGGGAPGGGPGGGAPGGDAGNPGEPPGGDLPPGMRASLNKLGLWDHLTVITAFLEKYNGRPPHLSTPMGPGIEITPDMWFRATFRMWRKGVVHPLQELLKVTPADKEDIRFSVNTLIKSIMEIPKTAMPTSKLKGYFKQWRIDGYRTVSDIKAGNLPLDAENRKLLETTLANVHILVDWLAANPTFSFQGDPEDLSAAD